MNKILVADFDRKIAQLYSSNFQTEFYCVGINKDAFFFLQLFFSAFPNYGGRIRISDEEMKTADDVINFFAELGPMPALLEKIKSSTFGDVQPLERLVANGVKNKDVFVMCSDSRRHESTNVLSNLKERDPLILNWRELLVFNSYACGVSYIPRVDFTVTYDCSLNCSYCNMFVPNARINKNFKARNVDDFRDFLTRFSERNIRIGIVHFVGGEPLLNGDLFEMMKLAEESDIVSTVWCTTNGTVAKNISKLDGPAFRKLWVFLTDYTQSIPTLLTKTTDIIDRLTKSLGKRLVVSSEKYWIDFGHPNLKIEGSHREFFDHFKKCTAPYRGYNKGKFYYCNLSLAATDQNLLSQNTGDFVDLSEVTDRELLAYDLGYLDNYFPELCRTCAGCNTGIETIVTPESQGIIKLRIYDEH